LFTHAFFKALLFSGVRQRHACDGDVIDMRKIGALRKVLPITHWDRSWCGAGALSDPDSVFRVLEQR